MTAASVDKIQKGDIAGGIGAGLVNAGNQASGSDGQKVAVLGQSLDSLVQQLQANNLNEALKTSTSGLAKVTGNNDLAKYGSLASGMVTAG